MGISFSTTTLAKQLAAASHTFLVMRIFFFRSARCVHMPCVRVYSVSQAVVRPRLKIKSTNQAPNPRPKPLTHPRGTGPPASH